MFFVAKIYKRALRTSIEGYLAVAACTPTYSRLLHNLTLMKFVGLFLTVFLLGAASECIPRCECLRRARRRLVVVVVIAVYVVVAVQKL